MLSHLSITNYALIENVELKFNNGFTVITGETGAGKSILLGALSLILGKRADISVLKNKQKKCIVEGEFNFQEELHIIFFNTHDLDYEEINIIRREVSPNGKSRAFINDTPVSLNILKELTSQLVDIHSQHQSLQIRDSRFQLNVIDAFSSLGKERINYSKKYALYNKQKKELNDLILNTNKAHSDLEYISFQVKELEELDIKPNEKQKIESELELMNNSEEIKTVLEKVINVLINSNQNLLNELKGTINLVSKITHCSEKYDTIYKRLISITIELEDVVSDIDNENNSLNFNPNSLTRLNERLSKIFSIEQKHNLLPTESISALLNKLKLKLIQLATNKEKVLEFQQLLKTQKQEIYIIAQRLSKSRLENFNGLRSKIKNSLALLGMADSTFEIKHELVDELGEYGIDNIEFFFTANKGMAPQELSKTASGGELSRLMLSIKAILANNQNLSTLIFDEIDTGVSGEVADKMANIMRKMSNEIQIITITHLPQVAAKGKDHYKIYKENIEGVTFTSLSKLNKADRVGELAKMLSGKELSSAAIDNAKILLEN